MAWIGFMPGVRPSRRTSVSDKRGASVDVEGLAGDVRRLVAAEERGGGRDVRGVAAPPHRIAVGGGLAEVLDRHADASSGGVGHVGGDEAGCDRVRGDAEGAELDAQGPDEALDAHLGGRVVGLTAVAERGDAGEAYDLAVLLLHEVLLRGSRHQEGTTEVDPHDQVPVVVTHLEQEVVAGDARVVDEDVETAELAGDAIDGALHRGGVTDVAGEADRAPAVGERQTAGSLGGLAAVEVEDRHRRALLGEASGDAEPDPSCGSGDDGDAPVEATHGVTPRRLVTVKVGPAGPAIGHCRASPGTDRWTPSTGRTQPNVARGSPNARIGPYASSTGSSATTRFPPVAGSKWVMASRARPPSQETPVCSTSRRSVRPRRYTLPVVPGTRTRVAEPSACWRARNTTPHGPLASRYVVPPRRRASRSPRSGPVLPWSAETARGARASSGTAYSWEMPSAREHAASTVWAPHQRSMTQGLGVGRVRSNRPCPPTSQSSWTSGDCGATTIRSASGVGRTVPSVCRASRSRVPPGSSRTTRWPASPTYIAA